MMRYLILLVLYPTILFSQNDTTNTFKAISIPGVIVSANRTPESKKYLTQQVEVLDSEYIKLLNSGNTSDLLSNSGLLHIQRSQQGGGSPVIRGFEASRVLLIIDGVRMNNLIYRAGHLQNVSTIDNQMLERVEVIYGPASTMYGSDALGGAIYLQTKNPQLYSQTGKTVSTNISSRYSSASNAINGHADITFSGQKWAALSAFSYSKFGDLRMGSRSMPGVPLFGARRFYTERIDNKDLVVNNPDSLVQRGSSYSQYDFMQKILFQSSPKISHRLNFQFSTTTDIPRYDRLTDTKGGTLKFAQWYYGPQQRVLANYLIDVKNIFANHNMKLAFNYQNLAESRHQREINNPNLEHHNEKVTVASTNVDFSAQYKRGTLNYGAEIEYDNLNSTAYRENLLNQATSPILTRYPNLGNFMYHNDIYTRLFHKITRQLSANMGLRLGFSHLKSTHNDTVFLKLPFTEFEQKNFTYSASAGLVYNPTYFLKLSGNVSTGYRVPNIDDMAKTFESTQGKLIIPNKDIKPEKNITIDQNVSLLFDERFTFENNFFYTFLFDGIVTSPDTYLGKDSILYNGSLSQVMSNQNQQRAFITGYSGSIKYSVFDKLSISAGLNYTFGRIIKDSGNIPLDHIPPLYGNVSCEYSLKKIKATLSMLFNGKKKIGDYYLNGEDNEKYAPKDGMPAWYIINFRTTSIITRNLNVNAGIENLLDTQYRTFASGINSAGRNYYISLNYNF